MVARVRWADVGLGSAGADSCHRAKFVLGKTALGRNNARMPSLMDKTIAHACVGTKPRTRGRMKALAKVRWVLATDDGWFVRVDRLISVSLTRNAGLATVYDGRDNDEMKCRFVEAMLHVKLTVVLIDQ